MIARGSEFHIGGPLKITGLILNETGGFISTQEDGEPHKCYFFWSKEQVSDIARPASGSVEHDNMEASLWLVNLPLTATRLPVVLTGSAARTVLTMLSSVGQLSKTMATTVVSAPVGMIYYLFRSKPGGVQNGLIGWSDPEGRHRLAIYFSREQGRQIHRKRMRWVPREKSLGIRDALDHPSMSERTALPMVELDGEFIGYINCAFWTQHESTKESGPEN